jgi:hypothetical protein
VPRQLRLGVGGFGLGARRFRAWALAASAPYRSGRRVCDGAERIARRQARSPTRRPPGSATGSSPIPGVLGEQARPLVVMAACHGVPESLIDHGLTGVRLIIWERLERPSRILLGLAAKIVAWQQTTNYEDRRNFNILTIGSPDVVQMPRSTEQYIFPPIPSL